MRYIKVSVPEDLYLPVLGFIAAGGKSGTEPDEDLDPLAVALAEAQRQNEALQAVANALRAELGLPPLEAPSLITGHQRRSPEEAVAEVIAQDGTLGEAQRAAREAGGRLDVTLDWDTGDPPPLGITDEPSPAFAAPTPVADQELPADPGERALAIGGSIEDVAEEAASDALPSPETTSASEDTPQPDGVAPPPTEAPRVTDDTQRGVKAAKTTLERGRETVQRFLAERTVKGTDDDFVHVSRLESSYNAWRQVTGAPPVSTRVLSMVLADLGHRRGKPVIPGAAGKQAVAFYGLRMVSTSGTAAVEDDRARRDREKIEFDTLVKAAQKPRVVVLDDNVVEPEAPAPPPAPKKAASKKVTPPPLPVQIFSADGAVATLEKAIVEADPDAPPLKPEDADKSTYETFLAVKEGMRDRPLGYLPEVLALEGVDTDQLRDVVHHPTSVEIRPESKAKGYPVIGFRRGDIRVIVGYRDQAHPAVIAAYWDALLAHDTHRVSRNTTGGGGAKKSTGLPTTVRASVKALRARGYSIPDNWEAATKPVPVSYHGQELGKMTVHLANKAQVQGDYQRLLRQGHAIDRREGVAV